MANYKLAKIGGKVVSGLTKLANLMLLNVMFIITSLPIVTIGASLSAMYTVTFKMVKDGETQIIKSYFKAFGKNFLQATAMWLLTLLALAVMAGDWYFAAYYPYDDVLLKKFFFIFAIVGTIVILAVTVFLFPLQARYKNTLGVHIKNAFLVALGSLPITLAVLLIWGVVIALCVYNYVVLVFYLGFVWLLFGIAAIFYLTSILMRKSLDKLDGTAQREEEIADMDPDEWHVTMESDDKTDEQSDI